MLIKLNNSKSLTLDKRSLSFDGEAINLLPVIYRNLMDLSSLYPNFKDWYIDKVVPGVVSGNRSILVELRNDKIAGIAIIKNDSEEKKLCCLRVMPDFQKSTGLGIKLFNRSMDELETTSPLLSVGEERIEYFKKIFYYFGYEKTKEYPDYYRKHQTELSFNGLLTPAHTFKVPTDYESNKLLLRKNHQLFFAKTTNNL